nr:zinc finger CCCH domain containing protein 31 [Hymenolepis microstoma]
MADTEKKICRYFNTIGGCWDKSSNGCVYGENCHFSHASASLKLVERSDNKFSFNGNVLKDSQESKCNSDRNNNSMAISSRLIISDPPQTADCARDPIELQVKIGDSLIGSLDNNREASSENNDAISMVVDVKEYFPVSGFQQEQLTLESQVMCGTCKCVLERRGNESYCNLLKDHYLECFLDKDGDHVKCVKMKAALEAGQMYWCKSCILIFEKPWSLFQHMADKAKGAKVQRWEKKIHLDWIDSVAGLMAGHDLGLFSLMKLRIDLRNLLADQYTMEEEMEMAAAAMVQWLVPITANPWRLHQREVMRKIEHLHRQLVRRAGGATELTRVALGGGNSTLISPSLHGSLKPKQLLNSVGNHSNAPSQFPPTREVDCRGLQPEDESSTLKKNPSDSGINEFECPNECTLEIPLSNDAEWHVAGASGDHPPEHYVDVQLAQDKTALYSKHVSSFDSTYNKSNAYRQCDIYSGRRSGYNMPTRSFRSAIASLSRDQSFNSAYRQYEKSRSKSFSESLRQMASPRVDLNCGFTDEEVEELLQQGIKPWDSEASAALAVLRGEMDHLLD